MNLKEIMELSHFVVVGNTIDPEKYAYKIKHQLIENGYTVECVGKELPSINDVQMDIDVIDLCIHPAKGIALIKEMKKPVKVVLIQPGAESDEIRTYLEEKSIPYFEGCALVGLSLYKKS